jgi:hypothetical protein
LEPVAGGLLTFPANAKSLFLEALEKESAARAASLDEA